MIRQIAPLFFTTDIPGTLAYYQDKLGFECQGTWGDPPIGRMMRAFDPRAENRPSQPIFPPT